jgi:hypothetical protein
MIYHKICHLGTKSRISPRKSASVYNLQGAARMQVEAYVAAGKQKHNQIVPPCRRGPVPKAATLLQRMRRKLQTILGRKIYARRKAIVEPVFGQIKSRQGFRQFLLRGAQNVRGEWALVCMTEHLKAPPRLQYVIGAQECGRTVALARQNPDLPQGRTSPALAERRSLNPRNSKAYQTCVSTLTRTRS